MNIAKNEEKILEFWKKNKTFEKSVKNRPDSKPYVFYDGPPFATGLPHYGHILQSLAKDIVPRYFTMRGFKIERKWGWDCHGLPIENLVEKELGLKSRKDIEEYGIDKFNKECHKIVLRYAKEWKKVVKRIGRWVDMENDYKTMDLDYMESVWWVFKELWDKGLIYQGHKAMHVCPRCETPLSNFEVTQGYKDVKDISVTAKFKLKNPKRLGLSGDVFVLAWTTTPWTLPGNVALAVGGSIKYCVLSIKEMDGLYIIAKDRIKDVAKNKEYKIKKEFTGRDLVGLEYEPLFPYFKNTENAFRIVAGDFVSTEDGTGVVHIAPAFGEDDYSIGQKEKIGWVQHVSMDGRFTDYVKDFKRQEVKSKEDPQSADLEILKWLYTKGLVFSKEKFEHSYPHCWRCDSPLINYATSSWFVRVTELKNDLVKNNKKIHWVPEHIKEGRFGKWLEGARDWAISRNRFWGAPLPVWQSDNGDTIAIGSVKELEKLSGKKITNIHKHIVDKIVIKKDGKEYKRIPEVLDCWFESGSMPYGQMHYPFENKKKFEASFPAEFIAEGQDQTRGWFYTLHILAAALTCGKNPSIPAKTSLPAFKNVIVNGIVLAEDGKKMSKRLKNYPDPMEMLNKYGADAMRFYLASSPAVHAESLNFSEKDMREIYNKVVGTLSNISDMYFMYGEPKKDKKSQASSHILDQWILAKLEALKKDTTERMDEYRLAEASRPILDFITELSQWYIRRSRARIKSKDKEALCTLWHILNELSKISAPFIPFISEEIFKKLNPENESVHLEDWPKYKELDSAQKKLLKDMETAREIVEGALALRAKASIKVRQPLLSLQLTAYNLQPELLDIIAEEVNVKEVKKTQGKKKEIKLNTKITQELKEEGYAREIVRAVNSLRKRAGLTPKDKISAYIDANKLKSAILKHENEIKRLTISKKINFEKKSLKFSDEVKMDGVDVWVGIESM